METLRMVLRQSWCFVSSTVNSFPVVFAMQTEFTHPFVEEWMNVWIDGDDKNRKNDLACMQAANIACTGRSI